jgi:hypothetical protein
MADRSDSGPFGIALELAAIAVGRIDSALQLVEQGGETLNHPLIFLYVISIG